MSKQLCYQVVSAILPHELLQEGGGECAPAVRQGEVTGTDLESLELWNLLP